LCTTEAEWWSGTNADSLTKKNEGFFKFLLDFYEKLKPFNLKKEIQDPEKTAIFSADMIVGFCSQGNLASERIRKLIPPIVELFNKANKLGINNFVLVQDAHDPAAPEFEAWPSHCVKGTRESEIVPEIANLDFSDKFIIILKNSLHPALNTKINPWLEENQEFQDLIVVGNCTDLCVYSLAMHLRLRANAYNLKPQRVILPANCVDTYDTPVKQAKDLGILPHPGDFIHLFFLYHMGH
jgi:nicotinamidase-related amidase